MPTPLVLEFDSSGENPANLIENEIHTLDESTGRIFALNYGGFYSASVSIKRLSDNHMLVPGLDFVALAPNDSVSKVTGLESMSVLALTKESDYEGDYSVTYQAVGGDYSTNVQVIRDVIEAISGDVGTVEWGLIINKPSQFDAAPHLIDFRKDLYGFEGLIESIQGIISKMSDISPSQIQAILTTINSGLIDYKTDVNNALQQMQIQINNILQNIPSTSGFFKGSPADRAAVLGGVSLTDIIVPASLSAVHESFSYARALGPGETLDSTLKPLVKFTGNIAALMASTAGVPNGVASWIVRTYWSGLGSNGALEGPVIQIAHCTTSDPAFGNGGQIILRRIRGVTPWDRVDAANLPNARLPLADDAALEWTDADDGSLATPGSIKRFMEINADSVVPVGGVITYASNNAFSESMQRHWKLCTGTLLSVAEYPELFDKIGYIYGGSGTTFRVPDLRGVVVRGYDNSGDPHNSRDRDRLFAEINDGFSHFGRYQSDEFKEHDHTVNDTSGGGTTNRLWRYADKGTGTIITTNSTNLTGGWETRMKNVAMHFIIRVK